MAVNPARLPNENAAIVDDRNLVMQEWRDFFLTLADEADTEGLQAEYLALATRVTALENEGSDLQYNQSVQLYGEQVMLAGDQFMPGLNYTYATGATTGSKGWYERLLASQSDVDFTTVAPIAGDLLGYDGTTWVPAQAPDTAVPYFIPDGDTYTVAVNKQALFTMPIDVEGFLDVEGYLVEVG